MEKSASEGVLSELVGGLFEIIGAITAALVDFVPKAIHFAVWTLLGLIMLPCTYIAGNIYPLWVEWGEKL